MESLSLDSLVPILKWSSQPYGSKWVHRQAMHFLCEEFSQVVTSDVLYELSKEHLLSAIQSDYLQVRMEHHLCICCHSLWHQCGKCIFRQKVLKMGFDLFNMTHIDTSLILVCFNHTLDICTHAHTDITGGLHCWVTIFPGGKCLLTENLIKAELSYALPSYSGIRPDGWGEVFWSKYTNKPTKPEPCWDTTGTYCIFISSSFNSFLICSAQCLTLS